MISAGVASTVGVAADAGIADGRVRLPLPGSARLDPAVAPVIAYEQ